MALKHIYSETAPVGVLKGTLHPLHCHIQWASDVWAWKYFTLQTQHWARLSSVRLTNHKPTEMNWILGLLVKRSDHIEETKETENTEGVKQILEPQV